MTPAEISAVLIPAPKPIRRFIATAAGLDEIEQLRKQLVRPFAESLLKRLEVSYRISDKELARIPQRGATVVVSNHPFGILDGAILATVLKGVREDVKFLANGILGAIPEIRDLLLPVDPDGGTAAHANSSGLRRAIEHLSAGGLLVVFPAGEVSHIEWGRWTVEDREWNPAVARIIAMLARRGINVTTAPVHISGKNSGLFQAAGLVHPRLRTAMLGRELLNKVGREVRVRVGSAVDAATIGKIADVRDRMTYLRWRTYLLAARNDHKPKTAVALAARAKVRPSMPVVAACDRGELRDEVAALGSDRLLASDGHLSAYIASAGEIRAVLGEIGRLREITFRAAGEGTGKPVDLDRFDQHYQHLFIWNSVKCEVVGAYRLARTDRTRELYTASLFRYDQRFLSRLGPAIELGRSFIRAEYQRSFSPLLLLWKGIGKFVGRNPQCKVLFGPVSISNEYTSVSRQLMVSFLEKTALMRDWMPLVRPLNPFCGREAAPLLPEGMDVEDLSHLVSDAEASERGVPVLLRQYLKLGGKLLGFNVDPDFSNAVDGLILVDLTKTERKLLDRYLGKTEAAQFLEFQKGSHAA